MHEVSVEQTVRGVRDPQAFLTRLWQFEEVATGAPDVVSVRVTAEDASGHRESTWEVTFRGGTILWTERDTIQRDSGRITFRAVDGDFTVFDGQWAVTGNAEVVHVHFTLSLDMGIPSMAGMIEPLAAKSVRRIILAMIEGAAR